MRTDIIEKIKERPIFYILLLSFVIRLSYMLINFPMWWDSHIYIGMGKFMFSSGQLGTWESFRPLIHPLIIGSFWKLGLDPLLIGKTLDLIFSLISIYLVFIISKKICNEKVAITSSLIFALTPLHIMFSGLILTEPLAIVLGLIGIYFFISDRSAHVIKTNYFLAGFFLALSFLTKFPQGIFFGSAFLVLLIKKKSLSKKLANISTLSLGFIIPVIPYFIYNYFRYTNMFEPFISGSWIVTTATWFYGTGISYYFTKFFLMNPIFLFFFGYIYLFYRNKEWNNTNYFLILLTSLLTLIYFIYLPRKEPRYLVTIVPLLAIMAGYTIVQIYQKLKEKPLLRPKSFVIICLILTLAVIPEIFTQDKVPTFNKETKEMAAKYNIEGTILSSTPNAMSLFNQPVTLLSVMDFAPTIYETQQGKYKMLIVQDCDLICSSQDQSCLDNKNKLLQKIKSENKEILKKEFIMKKKHNVGAHPCTYSIYLPK